MPLANRVTPRRNERSVLCPRRNVLIIDDEENLLEPLTLGLEQLSPGFSYTATSDPVEGMVLLDRMHVDVLVTDMIMPYVTGLDIIEQVVNHFPQTACILMTAYGSPDIELILDEYSVSYVEKPLDLDVLHRMIVNLTRESKTGTDMSGVILPTFVRVLATKELTCRVDIECREKKKGTLFFSQGELFNAKLGNLSPEAAAEAMLTCEKSKITIHQFKHPFRRKIHRSMEEILHVTSGEEEEPFATIGGADSFDDPDCGYLDTGNLIGLLSAGVTLKYNLLPRKE
ncbi:MAG TPA: response regulator [bacterium]|nr:response regulator [bacterium]